MAVLAGCSESATEDVPVRTRPYFDAEVHDFWPVIARGQILRHEFLLTNPTDRPLRVLGTEALTPCCSTISTQAGPVAPGSSARLTVTLNPGFQAERKQASFVVRLDDEPGVVRELSLVALLLPEVAESLENGSDVKILIGATGRQRIRFVFHQHGGEGRGDPLSVEAKPPLSARFAGPAETVDLGEGMTRSSRIVEVDLPASARPGVQRGVVTLRWGDGQSWNRDIEWQVIPRLVASPSGLTLKPDDCGTRAILLRSADRPFRVLRVDGVILAPGFTVPDGSSRLHTLTFNLDPSRVASGSTAGLRIATDDPDQPIVEITVLVLPTEPGGQP